MIPIKKTCFKCHEKKPIDQMESIGVWICKNCLAEMENKSKKTKK